MVRKETDLGVQSVVTVCIPFSFDLTVRVSGLTLTHLVPQK
jgi:hypothetical protein